MSVFDLGIAVIFTREFLEASVIIGQFRNVIIKSEQYKDDNKRNEALRAVKWAAIWSVSFAFVVCLAVTIPLALMARELDDKVVDIIEGVSKIIAAVCIAQLSLKLPKWLGVYMSKKKATNVDGISLRSIRFNVAWNLWREMAECGVFLIPYIVADEGKKIPVSAIVGTLIGLALGYLIYLRSKSLKSKVLMAFFCAFVTGLLSSGLFTGGSHELEEAFGETKQVYAIKPAFWNAKKFPMVFFKPFGYSHNRTVLQICAFWLWSALLVGLHMLKWRQTKALKKEIENSTEKNTLHDGDIVVDTSSCASGDKVSDIEIGTVETAPTKSDEKGNNEDR